MKSVAAGPKAAFKQLSHMPSAFMWRGIAFVAVSVPEFQGAAACGRETQEH